MGNWVQGIQGSSSVTLFYSSNAGLIHPSARYCRLDSGQFKRVPRSEPIGIADPTRRRPKTDGQTGKRRMRSVPVWTGTIYHRLFCCPANTSFQRRDTRRVRFITRAKIAATLYRFVNFQRSIGRRFSSRFSVVAPSRSNAVPK